MYSALTLVFFMLGSASAETGYNRTNATKLAEPADDVNPLIVGGAPVTAYEHNWVLQWTALYMKEGIQKGGTCGASLIHKQWAMTALHCTEGIAASDMKVHVYRHDRTGKGHEHRCTETLFVAEKFEHPDTHKLQYGIPTYDVALLRLSSAVKCDGSLKMPRLDDGDVSGSSCGSGRLESPENCVTGRFGRGTRGRTSTVATVLGWGLTSEHGKLSDVLKSADLNLLSNFKCDPYYMSWNQQGILDDSMICAISCPALKFDISTGQEMCYGQDQATCSGDSGGPLFVQKGGVDIIVGIVSWSPGCNKEDQANVFARVSHFKSWIEETTNRRVLSGLCPEGQLKCRSECKTARIRCRKNCGKKNKPCKKQCGNHDKWCKKTTCALCVD